MVDGVTVAREPCRPVHQPTRRHRGPGGGAEPGEVAHALGAAAAGGRPRERDVVARPHARDPLAGRLDHARALVPEHGRAARLGRPVDRVQVRVADAARGQPHEHLLGAGRSELEIGDDERSARPLEHCRPDVHAPRFLRLSDLETTQLLDRDVAAHQMAGLRLDERRLLLLADRAQLAVAAGVEDAARGRGRRARDLALEPDPLAAAAVDRRDGREERLGVRMVRAGEHDVRRPELLQAAEVEDGDPVGDVADDPEVVGDEEVRDLALRLQLDEEVEDRRLHRHVERGGRLVADDELRLARERPGDRHPLLEAARELDGLLRQRALGQPHALRQLEHPALGDVPAEAGELLQRAEEDPAHRVAAVERRVRVLEDDLERPQVGARALLVAGRKLPALEVCASLPSAPRSREACARASSSRCRTRRRGPASLRARSARSRR